MSFISFSCLIAVVRTSVLISHKSNESRYSCLNDWITLIDYWVLSHSYLPRLNLTWLLYMIFLVYCWIWCANILFRILHWIMFSKDIDQSFSLFFCGVFVWFWYKDNHDLIKYVLKISLFFSVLQEFWEE